MDENHKYRTILLFGMPGSGKGTQGAVLGQLPDLVHVSMGDVFRKIPKYGPVRPGDRALHLEGRAGTRRPHRPDLGTAHQDPRDAGTPPARAAHPDPRRPAPQLRAGRAARPCPRRHPDLPPEDQRHRQGERAAQGPALRENRLDDMNEEVIKRRLQTYYEETFQDPELLPRPSSSTTSTRASRRSTCSATSSSGSRSCSTPCTLPAAVGDLRRCDRESAARATRRPGGGAGQFARSKRARRRPGCPLGRRGAGMSVAPERWSPRSRGTMSVSPVAGCRGPGRRPRAGRVHVSALCARLGRIARADLVGRRCSGRCWGSSSGRRRSTWCSRSA